MGSGLSGRFRPSQSRKAIDADPIGVALVVKKALRAFPCRPVRKLRTVSFECIKRYPVPARIGDPGN